MVHRLPQRHHLSGDAVSVVSASALSRRFGAVAAVDSIDLEISGGVVGLLGPNGSGKTTLLRMLATVLSPTSGEVSIFGLDPSKTSQRTDIRRRLGYLPQEPGFYRGFSAFDLVDYVAVLKEMSERSARITEVRRVLAAVDLDDVMHKKIRSLSGGQRQRVALATALLGTPELLVLDEPATGLDPAQRLQLRSLLSEHGRSGTVVLSTHHTAEVAAFCQRVIVMLQGRVHFDGTPSELARLAAGRVWIDRDANAPSERSWIAADGTMRAIGDPPPGAELVEPTIDDGYLLIATAGAVR
jgi:ABC-2 type transport system ATP-binding protein